MSLLPVHMPIIAVVGGIGRCYCTAALNRINSRDAYELVYAC